MNRKDCKTSREGEFYDAGWEAGADFMFIVCFFLSIIVAVIERIAS